MNPYVRAAAKFPAVREQALRRKERRAIRRAARQARKAARKEAKA